MKTLGTILLILIALTAQSSAQELSMQVLDALDQKEIVGAHIIDANNEVITITNSNGYFFVSNDNLAFPLRIHVLGYQSIRLYQVEDGKTIFLEPQVLESEHEIIINGESESLHSIGHYQHHTSDVSMDQFLSKVDGLDMIQRGAFAWEPSVRGQSDQRLNVMIDGMAVFKACVDKMDPITSYVEVNNLSSLKIDKIGSSVAKNGNGLATINLQTESPSLSKQSLEFESNYKAPNNMYVFRVNTSGSSLNSKLHYRFSGSYRKSDDLIAGNNFRIENSEFEKWNLNFSISSKLTDKLQLETNYITDKAYDVGYPALLMDATSALADIIRIQLNIRESDTRWNIRSIALYSNMIRHTMNDYDRDVSSRSVMRDMNMPMYGETLTLGINAEGTYQFTRQNIKWYVNSYRSNAFGDMEMISTLPGVANMYIYNLNDVVTLSSSVGFEQKYMLAPRLILNLEQSLNLSKLQTESESYASFFEGIYQQQINEKVQILPSVSAELLLMLSESTSIKNSFVYSSRMGNHIEQYGHYIYNYVDGFFYDGNPWLKNEQALSSELELISEKEAFSYSISAFSRYYFRYIDGLIYGDETNQELQFKRYDNVGDAIFVGSEFRSITRLNSAIQIDHRMSYVYAQNITINEPLPLIPPLQGSTALQINVADINSTVTVDWASSQSRIATSSLTEDKTDGYAVFHLNFSKNWSEGRITSSLNLRNLTDKLYHTHTSIGNIPSEGFSVMAGLSFKFN